MKQLSDNILKRCIECGDCLLWQGWVTKHGIPSRCGQSLRRHSYLVLHGTINADRMIVSKCGENRCIRPEHMVSQTVSQIRKKASQNLALRKIRSHNSSKWTRSQSTINLEIAREIRNSTEPLSVFAKKYNMSLSNVSRIRRGEQWAESNPWAGLGA